MKASNILLVIAVLGTVGALVAIRFDNAHLTSAEMLIEFWWVYVWLIVTGAAAFAVQLALDSRERPKAMSGEAEDDGTTFIVGDKLTIDHENADEYRHVFGDEFVDMMLKQGDLRKRGVYVVTRAGSADEPWEITREDDP